MDERILENGKKLPTLRHVSVVLDDDTHRRLSRLAIASRRNVAFIIRGIVVTYLEDNNVVPIPSSSDQEVQE